MKSLTLKNQLNGLLAEQETLATKAELSAEDKTRWTELRTTIAGLKADLTIEEERENTAREIAVRNGNPISQSEQRDIQKFSLVKAIREMYDGSLTGLEREMLVEGRKEHEQIDGLSKGVLIPSLVLKNKRIIEGVQKRSTIAATSSPAVATEVGSFIEILWARLVLVALGAQTMSGLTSNLDLPYVSTKPTVKFDAENDSASDAAAALNKISLSPKRITNYIPISKLLLIQQSPDVERMLWDAMIMAMQVKVQHGAIAGGSDGFTGLLNTVGIGDVAGGTTGAAPTLAHILGLHKKVSMADADFGSLAYLTSPQARWKLMTTAIESGHPERVWNPVQPEVLMGYRAAVSSTIPDNLEKSTSGAVCSAITFGNWNKFMVAQFGAIELLPDPYTGAGDNITKLWLNGFFDAQPLVPAAFAAMKDALCAS